MAFFTTRNVEPQMAVTATRARSAAVREDERSRIMSSLVLGSPDDA